MIIIGSDHAGHGLKTALIKQFELLNMPYEDCGCDGSKVDYPDIAAKVCKKVLKDVDGNKGVLVCGTGVGMSIAANKHMGIRAAACSDYYSAKYTRVDNDSNVICLGGRTLGEGAAWELLQVWLKSEFAGGRHTDRLDKIREIEERERDTEQM